MTWDQSTVGAGPAGVVPSISGPYMEPMRSRIVTYAHRPKRPPRKKAKAAAINGPAVVSATSKRDRERRRETVDDGQEASPEIKAFSPA